MVIKTGFVVTRYRVTSPVSSSGKRQRFFIIVAVTLLRNGLRDR